MDAEQIEPGPEVLALPRAARPARFGDGIILISIFIGVQAVLGLLMGIVLSLVATKISATHISIIEAGAFIVTVLLMRYRLRSRLLSYFPIGRIRVSCLAAATIGAVGLLLILICIVRSKKATVPF
jgi:hypothetical protein